MKKLLKFLKGFTILTGFCGLLSVGCLFHDQTKHKVEPANADTTQVFTLYDSGNVDKTINYVNGGNDGHAITLSFTYRYQLYCKGDSVVNYMFRQYVSLKFNTSYATDLDFIMLPSPYSYGNDTFYFDGGWYNGLTFDASFYMTYIDGMSQGDSYCTVGFDMTNQIQGPFWETFTENVVFYDADALVNETWSIYQYINFSYNEGDNKIQLFDETSNLSSISLLDIIYQEGYQSGYNTGWLDAEGNVSYGQGYDDGYSTGYSEGYDYGYTNGYNTANSENEHQVEQIYQNGYSAGYNDGFNADSTALTIFSGILSVAMIPIQFFLNLFNFNVLGINLMSLIQAIFTVALTIVVVKMVVGKKGD